MRLAETTMEEQNAQRNFIVMSDAHEIVVSILGNERSYLPGDIEPSLTPCETLTNQDLAHVLIGIAANLLRAPQMQRLPLQ